MKVILITGASSGIGYATAELLAKNGYKVYAGARRTEKMETLKKFGVVPLSLDFTDEKSAEKAVKSIIDAEGKIDILFNNAGYGSYGAIECVSLEEAQKQLDVNVLGVARTSKLVLPYMRKQKDGRILVTSSIGGKVTSYLGGWYHVSKYAVESLSNSIRMDVKDFGIKVSIIEPGGVMTEWGSIAADHLEKSGKDSPYEKVSKQVADYYRKMTSTKSPLTNNAENLAKVVKKAIEAKNPKTRYTDTIVAGSSVLMSRLCPDKFIDKMMMNLVVK